ncbi:hypothetical protein CEXT_701121 [Caerostris extrusa]|uniref:Uncharacterized protein n=1 Tax=Caerostris extrusa TaxID=172846 RepID=A0AAV4NUB3_CAEEX|nr:hypothetical protein CEXT_701121 [Caerostris extrusa]
MSPRLADPICIVSFHPLSRSLISLCGGLWGRLRPPWLLMATIRISKDLCRALKDIAVYWIHSLPDIDDESCLSQDVIVWHGFM